MKKFFVFLSIFAIAASFTNSNTLPIGSAIPKANLKLKDVSGKEIMLNDAKKENGLLVMFSCNTCPVVIANQSRTKEVCQY
ncbi:MAG TPA: hypothetical protein VIH86_10840, partial [Puia sp.]